MSTRPECRRLPDERDVVGPQRLVARHDRGSLDRRLRDEHAVEGVAVMRREALHGEGVLNGHRERVRACAEQQREVFVGRIELSEGALDSDLPYDDGAEKGAIGGIAQMIQRRGAQPWVGTHEPQRGVGVEQKVQRAPNASAMSSGSSSKSSAM